MKPKICIKEFKMSPKKLYLKKKGKVFDIFQKHKLLTKPQMNTMDSIIKTMIKKPTTRLLNLSEAESSIETPFKSILNRYDYFFTQGMSFEEQYEANDFGWRRGDVVSAGYRRFFRENNDNLDENILRYQGKKIEVLDWTAMPKRSRAIYQGHDGMEFVGMVYDGRLKKAVVGYGILLGGFPLKEGGFAFYDFSLYSNRYMNEYPEDFGSMNDLEYQMIERSGTVSPAKETLLVMDSHFSGKNKLVHFKINMGIDFMARIDSDINVNYKDEWGNVIEEAERIKHWQKIYWREKDGEKRECEAVYFQCNLFCENSKKNLDVTIIYIKPRNWKYKSESMILVTTLLVDDKNLQEVINLYKYRWQIETAIEYLKQQFGLENIMLQHWEAIKCMIAFVLWVSFIFLICLGIMIKLELMTKLIKKFTVIKNDELTWGKTIWFYSCLFDRETMSVKNIEKIVELLG
jgi:hypothetical protein